MKTIVQSANLVPLCVVKVLEDHSDREHKLTQEAINQYLYSEYGIEHEEKKRDANGKLVATGVMLPGLERKAIGRTIERLTEELDIPIERDSRNGVWLEPRAFEDYELQCLIDGVYSSRYISQGLSKTLVNKLIGLGNEYFKNYVKYTSSTDNLNKTDNKTVFVVMDAISQAMSKDRQVEFDFGKYGPDLMLHQSSHNRVSPYRFVMKNGRYYLLAYHETHKRMQTFRLDHITNVKVDKKTPRTSIRKVSGWEDGITNDKIVSRPYFFMDPLERITFTVEAEAFDYIIDWLGYDIEIEKYTEIKNDKLKVTVKSSPKALKYFAMQFSDVVEVTSPKSLRDDIAKSLKSAAKKYGK